ncbi:uncharacterized protein PV07_03467 [Cladophialophora immunda]|uniref:Uncharacterized protein n=1 Tax=Cladophialophora immunda TaxID=569365 RepID=A0A0D2CL19_9EURO|nr:uncharacterized protein PV07_03467 [Cladophialophora immunda]KIW31878.1 hypothetical protein PV07_03467 [Cladophialophora immunda]
MAASNATKPERMGCASQNMVSLPSITDLLGRELAARLLPPPPPPPPPPRLFGPESKPPRSNSLPILSVDHFLLDHSLPCKGPILPPLYNAEDESTSALPAHEQLLTPPPTVRGSSSVCSTDTDVDTDVDAGIGQLRTLLNEPEPKFVAAFDLAQELLHDSAIKPAYDQGWFKPTSPTNKFSKRIEDRIAGKSLDELVDGFFRRDECRELYGERVSKPRKIAKTAPAGETQGVEELDPESMAKKKKRQEADEAHRLAENDRRDRHRESQMESHRRCPDLAAECGTDHAKAEKKTRIQSGKGPGKDDQLWTAIYAHEMAGRVVQSVNDRRRRAEEMVQLLLQVLIRQRELLDSPQRRLSHCDSTIDTFLSHPGHVGRKRTRDDMERESRRTWPSL